MICPKCKDVMFFCNGYASGLYGPDVENCRDPFLRCKNCGHEIEAGEPEPETPYEPIELPFD